MRKNSLPYNIRNNDESKSLKNIINKLNKELKEKIEKNIEILNEKKLKYI